MKTIIYSEQINSTLKEGHMNECYISVDVETTGPIPGSYSMFEIGACVVGQEEIQFDCTLRLFPEANFEQEALTAIGIESISKIPVGTDIELAMSEFALWVKRVAHNTKPVFVANNAAFDWMFVHWYFVTMRIENPFGHSALDMKAYFMGMTGCSWKQASLKNMAQYVAIPFPTLPHRALSDAVIQSNIFSKLLNIRRCGT